MKVLILGAGCTGLGAAYRLHELGHTDFLVLEQNSYPGGLATSFVDEQGFTWDIGGHVQFSHYDYFDRLMDKALGRAWLNHMRESYIWIRDRYIPYPFQYNIRSLPAADVATCVRGLIAVQRNGHTSPKNFAEWIVNSFGQGIADIFLLPYNTKVWACNPAEMSFDWVGERVARLDLARVVDNILSERDDPAWGPNNTFQFPLRGGTGAIWRAVADLIPASNFRYNRSVAKICTSSRTVTTSSGDEYQYDALISTLPIDAIAALIGDQEIISEASQLRYSGTHVVGIGIQGNPPAHLREKNWLYFPEDNCPFYRVTVFSNYSPHNVPGDDYWSLMAEVADSSFRVVNHPTIVQQVLEGMRNTKLLSVDDRIVSSWHYYAAHGYPTPTVDRDVHIDTALAKLKSFGILSRGRFGAWRYEVGNQDHSCMQGVEAADCVLFGAPELTCWNPNLVNSGKHRDQRNMMFAASSSSHHLVHSS
ncbi:MAG: FAD-dependent oxidoreductase [Terracidiphilus sp.]